ncbi:MAG: SRPBCC family protein [Lapillicoccus sp.]
MITVSRRTTAAPEDVWAVLADGWSYATWVVGASRIRAVDRSWPEAGARIHHSVGTWPLLLSDETVVADVVPGEMIRMHAKARPLGEAVVEIELRGEQGGTRIEMREDALHGPMTLAPKPLRQLAIRARNTETVLRLALLAERSTSAEAAASP